MNYIFCLMAEASNFESSPAIWCVSPSHLAYKVTAMAKIKKIVNTNLFILINYNKNNLNKYLSWSIYKIVTLRLINKFLIYVLAPI